MDVHEIVDVLEAENDLMSVATSLGSDCLNKQQAVRQDRFADVSDTCSDLLIRVIDESKVMWDENGKALEPPSGELKGQLAKLWATPELATVTVLEGICLGIARGYFTRASSVVTFGRGAVVPLPQRWLYAIPAAPRPSTTHPNLLGERCNFVLWDLDDWALELDFRFRDRLDLVCAIRVQDFDKRDDEGKVRAAYALPKIAAVCPLNGNDMAEWPDDITSTWFFGVHPKVTPTDGADAVHRVVFDALARVGSHAALAVLPEFCLLSPHGLDELMRDDAREMPALVVAGSAHTGVERSERANTSRVFLDRYCMMSVSKHNPFVLRIPGAAQSWTEDICPQDPRVIRVAAGTATRLAVAICADLNSTDLVGAMTKAGVNLVLSPSWSPRIGAAAAGLTQLAGYCQCVGLVANTPGHVMAEKGRPTFWACTAVPRESDQTRPHYHTGSPPAVGVLDPNLAPTDGNYWTWIP